MARNIFQLKEKQLENVPAGYSFAASRFIDLANNLFQYVERASLWPWYRRIPIDRPIFIIGPYRSGTTLLEEVITSHPSVGYFWWITNNYFRAPLTGYFIVHILLKLGVLTDEKIPILHNPRMRQNTLSPYECEWVWSQSKDSQWNDQVRDLTVGEGFSDPHFEGYLFSMIRRHLFAQNTTRFLNKNPVNCLRIGYLHKLFPDARMVYIVRDPVDTIISHYRTARRVERVWYADPKTKWILQERLRIDVLSMRIKTRNYARTLALNQEHPLLGIANQWADMQLAVSKSLAKNSNLRNHTLELRYEDLVSQPEDYLRILWDFIEMDDEYTRQLIQYYAERISPPTPKSLSDEELGYLPRIQEIVSAARC